VAGCKGTGPPRHQAGFEQMLAKRPFAYQGVAARASAPRRRRAAGWSRVFGPAFADVGRTNRKVGHEPLPVELLGPKNEKSAPETAANYDGSVSGQRPRGPSDLVQIVIAFRRKSKPFICSFSCGGRAAAGLRRMALLVRLLRSGRLIPSILSTANPAGGCGS
jgi:hypothetical protein